MIDNNEVSPQCISDYSQRARTSDLYINPCPSRREMNDAVIQIHHAQPRYLDTQVFVTNYNPIFFCLVNHVSPIHTFCQIVSCIQGTSGCPTSETGWIQFLEFSQPTRTLAGSGWGSHQTADWPVRKACGFLRTFLSCSLDLFRLSGIFILVLALFCLFFFLFFFVAGCLDTDYQVLGTTLLGARQVDKSTVYPSITV